MAIRKELSADQVREYNDLYAAFVIATRSAGDVLAKHGMTSKEFEAADRAAGELREKMDRLAGRRTWLG